MHLLACLGYSDPHKVEKATPAAMLEVGEMLSIDGHKLWQEFTEYKSLVKTLQKKRIEAALKFLHSPSNKETMAVAYPLISDIHARIAVLPASSAEVERVFLAMKRIKTPVCNRIKTGTLDHLLRVSIEGPEVEDKDPYQH